MIVLCDRVGCDYCVQGRCANPLVRITAIGLCYSFKHEGIDGSFKDKPVIADAVPIVPPEAEASTRAEAVNSA